MLIHSIPKANDHWTHVTPLADPIVCDLVKDGVMPRADGNYTVADRCRKEPTTCHLPDFLAEQRLFTPEATE